MFNNKDLPIGRSGAVLKMVRHPLDISQELSYELLFPFERGCIPSLLDTPQHSSTKSDHVQHKIYVVCIRTDCFFFVSLIQDRDSACSNLILSSSLNFWVGDTLIPNGHGRPRPPHFPRGLVSPSYAMAFDDESVPDSQDESQEMPEGEIDDSSYDV